MRDSNIAIRDGNVPIRNIDIPNIFGKLARREVEFSGCNLCFSCSHHNIASKICETGIFSPGFSIRCCQIVIFDSDVPILDRNVAIKDRNVAFADSNIAIADSNIAIAHVINAPCPLIVPAVVI